MARETRRGLPKLRLAKKYTDFQADFLTLMTYLGFNYERLRVDGQTVFELSELREKWLAAYDKYSNPDTHTPTATAEVESAYGQSMGLIRKIQQQVKNDAAVELTTQDRYNLLIRERETTKTRATVPAKAPYILVVKRMERSTTFRAMNNLAPKNRRNALPPKTKLLIKVAYPATGEQPTEGDFRFIHDSRRALFTVTAPDDIPQGTLGYVKAAYVSTLGEQSPFNEPPVSFAVN